MEILPSTLRSQFFPYRHTILLGAIVSTLAVRPLMGDVGAGPVIFSIALLMLMLMSLYTIQIDDLLGEHDRLVAQRRRRSLIGWGLAVPAIIDRLLVLFVPGRSLYLIGSIIWFFLFAFITINELRLVLRQRDITRETISLSISIYLLIAFTWGLLYITMYQVHPDAFNLGNLNATGAPPPTEQQVSPVLVYFSIITISTVGYGDILPMSLQARYAAAAEGIAGQFYLAILVARLVGIYMSKQTEQGGSNESSNKADGSS